MSKVQLHRIDKGKSDQILDVFVAIGAFSQVVIGIILILQLKAYRESNELTRGSIELNRKAIILSHAPWLSIQALSITVTAPDQLIVALTAANHSDYPVFKMKSAQYISTDGSFQKDKPDVKSILESRISNDTVMPHDERSFVNLIATPKAAESVKQFYNNQATLKIYIQYEDMFHRKMMFINTIKVGPTGPPTWRILDSHIDGLDDFDVQGL